MKNNIYVLLVILLILIILIILFLKTRNLENLVSYPFSSNINFINQTPSKQIKEWTSGMYLTACQNECSSDPSCRALKANGNNDTPGSCKLYNNATMTGTPQYVPNSNIYYKTDNP